MNVFTNLGDIDLLNLAESSQRFENIAKLVINQRYAHKHFVATTRDYSCQIPDTYTDFFERFGSEIKAFEMQEILFEDHWILWLLNQFTNLKKLKLRFIGYEFNENLLQQHANLTHLTLDISDDYFSFKGFALPVFHGLKKLEINNYPSVSFESLKEVIRNNPALEGLHLGEDFPPDKSISETIKTYPFDEIIMLISAHLNQLKEFSYVAMLDLSLVGHNSLVHYMNRQPDHVIDRCVDSLKHLESLALSPVAVGIFTDFHKFVRRLSSRCKNIKHLELRQISGNDSVLFEALRPFRNIKSLVLKFIDDDTLVNSHEFKPYSLIVHMPVLQHLTIRWERDILNWSFVLKLLRNSQYLEKVSIYQFYTFTGVCFFGSCNFVNDFRKFTIDCNRPNAEIEIISWDERGGRVYGSVTKDKVILLNGLFERVR